MATCRVTGPLRRSGPRRPARRPRSAPRLRSSRTAPTRQAVPKAYVTLAAGWESNRETALAILRYARDHLAPYQRVRRLEFADLPRTMSGKIRRVELRGRERDAADTGTESAREWRDDQFPELRG